ncbi:HEAT repeat domain-containing protein [Amycolatopsis sp. NEAU-NG30]|uniref:HEAT repeat domain-containing protein n=1 Tax=Amycolatopsis melonis TaxID=3156488 RepID=A0ABV0LN83_9PSEU
MRWGDWRFALRELAGGDPDEGYEILAGALVPPPGEWNPAASDAAPELLRHAEDRTATGRSSVLDVVDRVAHAAREAADRSWPPAWAAAVPRLTALLGDPDDAVRQAAALALGAGPDPGGAVLRTLLGHFATERSEAVRAGLVVAVAELGGESVVPWLAERAADTALAVAVLASLARITGEIPVTRFADAFCEDLSAYDGMRGWHLPHHVLEWAVEGLAPPVQAEILLEVAARPLRQAAAREVAVTLVAERPSTTEALLPVFGRLLETPECGPAAAVLGCLAPESAGYADRLAALLDDAAGQDRDLAMWALLRLRDRRAVGPQLARLTGAGPGDLSLRDLFGHAPEFADEVVPWACDLLRHPVRPRTVSQLARLLAAWGPVAAPAVPLLAGHLGSEEPFVVQSCAGCLAAIGVAGEPVLSALAEAVHRTRLPWAARCAAATAFAVLGGDPSSADALLAEGLVRGDGTVAGLLAVLGPAAAHHAPALRAFECPGPSAEVAVARALARLTGDTAEAVPVLLRVLAGAGPDQPGPAAAEAARALAELGPLPAGAAPVLRELLARDERLSSVIGWKGILEDRELRRNAALALENCVA